MKQLRISKIKTADIRQAFLDYFVKNDHKLMPSSPVIPYDDPTILFTNAGMNQFKDIFTGKSKVDFKRATSSQKCIRAGGKHNDLDNVGFTARHHTFFEMMGNFSFGDYFKEQAISYAWEFLTKELGLPKDKLYASVYETDDEAFDLWGKIAPELKNGRILRFGKKDNYWSMGDIGPCGPCSEIHIDRGEKYGTGPEDVVNGETDRFMEIWNLVFMQQDQLPDGTVIDLPKPSVDTGAGLERFAAVLQNVDTNYGIDLFQNLIAAVSDVTGSEYADHVTSHHVIADHLRALSFALADGAGISNEGQGYVLRRILRRAARHGRLLGVHDPFIYKLVPTLVDEMGDAYPELKEKQSHLENVIKAEEESFGRTLDTGLELFEKAAKSASGKTIDGDTVFKLYDTFGFPVDLTEILATEKGLSIDLDGFNSAMAKQKESSRASSKMTADTFIIPKGWDELQATEFVREELELEATLLGISAIGDKIAVVTDRTPFYVESGGQTSDTGKIVANDFQFNVESMMEVQSVYYHLGTISQGSIDSISTGDSVKMQVEENRRNDIIRNHTATHLAQAALRKVLGEHIKQSGSYVGPDRLRFDFSHHQPMTNDEINQVENIVNQQILNSTPIVTEIMDVDAAKKSGAMALFGEKYGDKVRVVSVADFSKELCGGTHVDNSSQIGPFFITLETGIASGVRRIEAITGTEAINKMLSDKSLNEQIARSLKRTPDESLAAIKQIQSEKSALEKEIKRLKAEMFSGAGQQSIGTETARGNLTVTTHDFGDTDRDMMAAWIDKQKEADQPIVAFALGNVNGKRAYVGAASSKAVKENKINIGAITKELLSQFGGRGGGKPNFAQGSVANDTNADELFQKAIESIPE